MNSNKTSISVAVGASASTSATLLLLSNHFMQTRKRLAWYLDEEEDPPRYRAPLDYTVIAFDLDSWSEERCLEYFRKCDIESLSFKLGLDNLAYPHGIKPSRILAFCIVLGRLSSPTRYKDTI
ncbi:hypothetical protein B9Z19DRAFT_1065507 [Tuber borchii]|uniref:Uncharacterized protein n=1 Tax=Tuber borchii TaxID=42251 RepID=A0A2T6ZQW0_TUBBO|nr:hypothetical protein B9Z19DRAFT_1065507 [Tuber borchii]